MAFVKRWVPEVGDVVKLTRKIDLGYGYFQPGTIVTIIDKGERGYSIKDADGNVATECGWSGFEKITDKDCDKEPDKTGKLLTVIEYGGEKHVFNCESFEFRTNQVFNWIKIKFADGTSKEITGVAVIKYSSNVED